GRKNLGQYDGHPGIRFLIENFLNIIEDGSQDGSVGRRQHDEIDTTAPLRPLHFDFGGLFGIGIHQQPSHFSPPASRIVPASDHGPINATDRYQHDIAPRHRRPLAPAIEPYLFSDRLVMRMDLSEHRDDERDQYDHDPGAMHEFRTGNDRGRNRRR